ncbi:hypothetical protein [Prauserella endophytica]|uniref:Uncharacterized protein n=1 Tax=Prauserella endophytica TaxID=1592324 RepID=A0ABY2RVI5_9PSEU|nr:hypothetical protein [Prauserella endophytica]TKG61499.1 hypothetical protein FCN18_33195 [Prauserella endophytica]
MPFSVEIERRNRLFGLPLFPGLTRYSDPRKPEVVDYSDRPDKGMVVSYVGPVAELRAFTELGYRASAVRGCVNRASESDMHIASMFSRYASIDHRKARKIGEQMVDRNWSRIVRVAKALRGAGGYLTGKQVVDLL